MGPCRNKDKVSYNKGLNALIETLKGNDAEIIISLEKEMKLCVNNLKFEEAQKYKEDIESIRSISSKSKSINFIKENYNVLAITNINDTNNKLYFLKGKEVKFTKILSNEDIKNKEYIQNIIEDIKLYLSFEEKKFVNTTIGKEELDICTIIYNYLKHSKDCKYLILNEEITDVELCKWIVDFD
jgi:excinuclease ABC subunit C